MNTNDLNMAGDTTRARTEARKAAKRTAIILGVLAFSWYFGFMAMRLL